MGFLIGASSFICIPLYMVYKLVWTPGSLKQVRSRTDNPMAPAWAGAGRGQPEAGAGELGRWLMHPQHLCSHGNEIPPGELPGKGSEERGSTAGRKRPVFVSPSAPRHLRPAREDHASPSDRRGGHGPRAVARWHGRGARRLLRLPPWHSDGAAARPGGAEPVLAAGRRTCGPQQGGRDPPPRPGGWKPRGQNARGWRTPAPGADRGIAPIPCSPAGASSACL